MSFKVRNTIVLAVFFVLLVGGGTFYWWYWQPKELDSLTAEIDKIDKELGNLQVVVQEVERLTQEFQELRRKYDSRSKIVPTNDLSSQTYEYISRGIDEAGFFQFSFQYSGTKTFKDYGYNSYFIRDAEADFDVLYKFIYYLENSQRLYKINSISLDQTESIDQVTQEPLVRIRFTIELHAYFTSVAELSQSLAAAALSQPQPPSNPFHPLVWRAISSIAPAGEIDVNGLDVRAVLPGKALVLTGGSLLVLHLGDKVWRGYVSRISPSDSKVEFTVDEGGIVRVIEKKIQFVIEKKR